MSTGIKINSVFLVNAVPALGYAVLIFIMSSFPGYIIPNLPFFSFDKLVHLFEFGLFGIFVYRAFRFYFRVKQPYLATLVTCIPYAALDEFHQYFVQGRQCSIYDFTADLIGIVFFAALSAKLNVKQL
ncbi:MAG: VanZ family protein [Candidatus Latescibacteria bacterium]|nr:VanZ family protein [Candidatus Latescibacterota bacterium]